jgi:hypothetical protein
VKEMLRKYSSNANWQAEEAFKTEDAESLKAVILAVKTNVIARETKEHQYWERTGPGSRSVSESRGLKRGEWRAEARRLGRFARPALEAAFWSL